MPRITIVGSFCVDILIRADRLPVWGETLLGRDFYLGPGGKGGNMAAAAARMGAQISFVTAVGDDNFAQRAFDFAASENIDPTHIRRIPGMTTSIGFGLLDPAGRSACITDPAALSAMDAAFVDQAEQTIAQSDAVITMLENPLEAAARALRLGQKHGKLTILNPAPAMQLTSEILADADILTPNESELRVMLGLAPDDPSLDANLARELQRRANHGRVARATPQTLIVTRGEKGALIIQNDQIAEIAAPKVDVIDTTGAGDAFNATLAVALTEGKSLPEAVRLANCAGALACTKLGSIPSYGRRKDVEEMRQKFYA
jgi:ribokinase